MNAVRAQRALSLDPIRVHYLIRRDTYRENREKVLSSSSCSPFTHFFSVFFLMLLPAYPRVHSNFSVHFVSVHSSHFTINNLIKPEFSLRQTTAITPVFLPTSSLALFHLRSPQSHGNLLKHIKQIIPFFHLAYFYEIQ